MEEVTKEWIFTLAAIANILALFLLIIPYFQRLTTNYRTFLILILILFLVIFISKIISLRSKKYPVSIKNNHIFYTIEDIEGRLVHCEKNQLIRANQDFIATYNEEIIVDGKIENISGSIEGSESATIIAPVREGMTWNIQHVFNRPLPKNKYLKRTFSFDFIDSFTRNNEYIVCWIRNIVDDFEVSIIFPENRPPREIKGFLRRGQIEIEKQDPPLYLYELPDKRKRIDWQVKHPKIGDIYKVIWSW